MHQLRELPITFETNPFTYDSMSTTSRQLVWALHMMGYRVQVVSPPNPPIQDVRFVTLMRRFLTLEPSGESVRIMFFKGEQPLPDLPNLVLYEPCDSFVAFPNRVNEWNRHLLMLATNSYFSKEQFKRWGVDEDLIAVVPPGIDFDIFNPKVRPIDIRRLNWRSNRADENPQDGLPTDVFCFLNINYYQPRKGLEELLKAYLNAFVGDEDVCLLLKAHVGGWGRPVWEIVRALSECYERPARVWYSEDVLTEREVAMLISACDCYVSAHRIEGFGLSLAHALAIGKPVIATAYGGVLEFLNERNAFLIPARERKMKGHVPPGSRWAIVDTEALSETMRKVRKGKCECERKAKVGQQEIKRFTWKRSAQLLLHELYERGIAVSKIWSPSLEGETTIIILNCNNLPLLKRCIESLFAVDAGAPFEIVVVDNGSRDGSVRFLKQLLNDEVISRHLRVIFNRRNVGACTGRNQAIRIARGDAIAFMDSDVEANCAGWLRKMRQELFKHRVGIVVPKLLHTHAPDAIYAAGGMVFWRGWESGADLRLRGYGAKSDEQKYNRSVTLKVAPSAMWLVRRCVIDQVGGFWEEYDPVWHEDSDFCMDVRLRGWKVRYIPSVTFMHAGGATSAKFMSVKERNRHIFTRWWGGFLSRSHR
ncbi:MAG TPA: glycosyltransferase [Armatimonadetes bacterium]|nr:glycosyltransferase [Armatimonadota bacterium]